jgi:S1-C subfamily serine protease
VATITGDRPQRVARLRDPLQLGDQVFPRPVVELTDALSSLGGGALRHFTVTFDQRRDRVFLQRVGGPLPPSTPRWSAGLSFAKSPAYWRVASVVAGSPAAQAGVRTGDLVVRINGEPVAQWDRRRYDEAVERRATLTLTFLNGSAETDRVVGAFELVP